MIRYLCAAMLLATAACSSGDEVSPDPDGNSTQGSDPCSATLQVLQKDAYKETAGRTSALWPPHTTTQLTMSCESVTQPATTTFITSTMANHGTLPDERDANGELFLTETKSVVVEGSRSELLELLDAYGGCECDGVTAFLSLDALKDDGVSELLASLSDYLKQNLSCNGTTDVDGLLALIEQGQVQQAVAVLPDCVWTSGSDMAGGLDEALQAVIAALGEVISGYHVCNNDAALQLALVESYRDSGALGSCDTGGTACQGPMWFYEP